MPSNTSANVVLTPSVDRIPSTSIRGERRSPDLRAGKPTLVAGRGRRSLNP
jgi:hypothetical protein